MKQHMLDREWQYFPGKQVPLTRDAKGFPILEGRNATSPSPLRRLLWVQVIHLFHPFYSPKAYIPALKKLPQKTTPLFGFSTSYCPSGTEYELVKLLL